MKKAHVGFTLAELLIAIALLGLIAAFTIPKVIQSATYNETTAKIREAVSTLEQAYYGKKMLEQTSTGVGQSIQYGVGMKLYQNIQNTINTQSMAPGAVPATVLPAGHPCIAGMAADYPASGNGWIQMPNGVVITGLESGADFTNGLAPNSAATGPTANYIICIDANGSGGPNLFGADIFIGNFNLYGGFLGPSPNPYDVQKTFNWGNTSNADVVNTAAAPLPVGGAAGPGSHTAATPAIAGALLGK